MRRLAAGLCLSYALVASVAAAQTFDAESVRVLLIFDARGFEVPAEGTDQDFFVSDRFIPAAEEEKFANLIPVPGVTILKVCRLKPTELGSYTIPRTIEDQKQYCTIYREKPGQMALRQSPK